MKRWKSMSASITAGTLPLATARRPTSSSSRPRCTGWGEPRFQLAGADGVQNGVVDAFAEVGFGQERAHGLYTEHSASGVNRLAGCQPSGSENRQCAVRIVGDQAVDPYVDQAGHL